MGKTSKKESKIHEAAKRVLEVLEEVEVAFNRELRYRLESEFPHDVVGHAIEKLRKEGKIKQYGVPGRKGAEDMPNVFYALPGKDYRSLLPKAKEKLELAAVIHWISSSMGRYAEEVWFEAFKERGWEVYPSTVESIGRVREFKGREALKDTRVGIDFIVEKDGVAYGVEVKNRLPYPDDLFEKILVAVDLDLVPLIIARWLNPSQVRAIRELGGFYVIYKTAIYSPTYKEIVDKAVKILGYPIECRERIDDSYFEKKIVKEVHDKALKNLETVKDRLKAFKEDVTRYREWRKRLSSPT